MLRLRNELLPPYNVDELDRQYFIYSNFFKEYSRRAPRNLFESKVIAVMPNDDRVNWEIQARVTKHLDHILNFVNLNDITEKTLDKLKAFLIKNNTINAGDIVKLPAKKPILVSAPEFIPTYHYEITTCIQALTNLLDFETIYFNNKTLFRYYENTSFASYLYLNLIYSLNLQNVDEEALIEYDDGSWKMKLLLLLKHIRLDNLATMQIFYKDKIEFEGIMYDCSFVPKYDVRNLPKIKSTLYNINNQAYISFFEQFDPSKSKFVPPQFISIFLTFPFKNGYYMDNMGKIHYLNYDSSYSKKRTVQFVLGSICNTDDLETVVESVARQLSLHDAIAAAVYAENLFEAARSLLILRRLIGDVVNIKTHHIQLPAENSILNWTSINCHYSATKKCINNASSTSFILPNSSGEGFKETYKFVHLIKAIAMNCCSKLGASIMCASYKLPELALSDIYASLDSHAEKFVFFTILLQDYNYEMYRNVRDCLSPKFGCSKNFEIDNDNDNEDDDTGKYQMDSFKNFTVFEKLDLYTERFIKPNELIRNITCSYQDCLYLYEFENEQLNELVATGNVEFQTSRQIANFLTVLLTYNCALK